MEIHTRFFFAIHGNVFGLVTERGWVTDHPSAITDLYHLPDLVTTGGLCVAFKRIILRVGAPSGPKMSIFTKESSFSSISPPRLPRPSPLLPQFPSYCLGGLGVFLIPIPFLCVPLEELGVVEAPAAETSFFFSFESSRSLSPPSSTTPLVSITLPLVRWSRSIEAFAEVSFDSSRRFDCLLLIPYLQVPLVQTFQVD